MKPPYDLTLAYRMNALALSAISLVLILAPSTRVLWVYLTFAALTVAHCVLGVGAHRLQGQTLQTIYQNIRDGHRPVSSHWDTVVVLLMLGAVLVTGLSVG